MRRTVKLILVFLRQAFMREMAYPQNFWIAASVQTAGAIAQIIGIVVLFSHTNTIAGWSKDAALTIIAFFGISVGALRMLFEGSFKQFCRSVHDGSFDFSLVRPVPLQLSIAFQRITFEHTGSILFGVFLLGFLALRGMVHFSVEALLGTFGFFAIGMVIGYALWFALTLFTFWIPNVEHFGYLYTTILSISRYPLEIYGRIARQLFLTVLPIGFIVTIPVESFLGLGTTLGFLISIAVAISVCGCTHFWWRFAVRHYSSASS